MSSGKRPGEPQTVPQPQPIQPQPILVTRVLDVGPPLVPRQHPQAPAPPAPPVPQANQPPPLPPARSAAATLGALPPMQQGPFAPPQAPPPAPPPPFAARPPTPPPQPGPAPPRPAAPNVGPSPGGGESLWDSVEALLDDVDAGFGAIMNEPAPGEAGPNTIRNAPQAPTGFTSPSGGLSNARQLFGELATAHVRHVRDFMIDVKAGQATTEWLALCEPAVRSVRQMAEQLELRELCGLLDAYLATLRLASEVSGFSIDGEARGKLLGAYEPLIVAMPDAFGLDAVKSKREGIIVQSLLLQIPEVRKVTIDKLYAAGLTTLDTFFLARPDEIALTTGVDIAIAKKVAERFRRYKQDMQAAAVDESRSFEHARLAELRDDLSRYHQAFEQAEKNDDGAQKRAARKAREAALLEIKVLLARLGEVERVSGMDKLPFSQKVAELTKYLEEAAKRP